MKLVSSFDSELDYERSKPSRYQSTRSKHPLSKPVCNYCKKSGHIEADCYRKQNDSKRENKQDKTQYKPKQQDYKRSQNPKVSFKDTGVKPRPISVNWNQVTATKGVIKGKVNDTAVDITVDTAAGISVVPGRFVYTDNLTGNTVDIKGVNGDPVPYQTAIVPITLKGRTVMETVAVASTDMLNDKVLLSTPPDDSAVNTLVDKFLLNKDTDSPNKDITSDQPIEVNVVTRPKRIVDTIKNYYPEDDNSSFEDDRASDVSYNDNSDTESSVSSSPDLEMTSYAQVESTSLAESQPVAEPQSVTESQSIAEPQSVTESQSIAEPQLKADSLPLAELKPIIPVSIPSLPSTADEITDISQLPIAEPQPVTTLTSDPVQLPTFPVLDNKTNIEAFKTALKSDLTLKVIRGLAHHNRNGYSWDNGLIIHVTLDPTLGERKRLVVPKPLRAKLLTIAHDKSGHFSTSKTRSVLNHRFTWPSMGTDITDHVLACVQCKQYNKSAHKPAPLHYRPTITEPYDEVAIDIIGPLPRAKHGYRYALTMICMASRWPEVYPMVKPDAEHVANALIKFLARNGIPTKILTDQGAQFMSNVMNQTCKLLGITHKLFHTARKAMELSRDFMELLNPYLQKPRKTV